MNKIILHNGLARTAHGGRILQTLLVAEAFLPLMILTTPQVNAGDQIQIPLRWCAVQGSPAVTNPGGVGEPDTDNVLWRRHERASDRIWIPGANITFRSGITAALRDQGQFPIINDPNPPASAGPGQLGDIVDPQINSTELNNAIVSCRAAWDALARQFNTTLVGPIALNLRQFVDNNGNSTNLVGWGGFTALNQGANTCANPPTNVTSAIGGFASVVDNSFSLAGDPIDALLAHELGHVLRLGHGNGLDDDNDGVYDDNVFNCDPDENVNAGPANMMAPIVGSGVITTLQRGTSRPVARVYSGAQLDPPGALINSDTVSDQRVDTVHDVTDDAVDIVTVSLTENTVAATTIISHTLFGVIPLRANNQYLLFTDLDGNPATGGSPSSLGFSTAFQGAELVTRVVVEFRGDPEFPTRVAVPTVWKFQAGAFVEVADPGIRAEVQTPLGGETPLPLFDVVTIQMPNTILSPAGSQVRIQALAQQLDGIQLDQLPDGPTDSSVPLVMVPPQFPVCSVTPAQVPAGATATVEATGLLPNQTAKVILGDQLVATGPIDSAGKVIINFTVPGDSEEGPRLVTVGVMDTALTADCSVTVTPPPPLPTCFGVPATIVGTDGNDVLNGTLGNDVIVDLGGNDAINGNGGNDIICGDDGNDAINTGAGNDRIDGGAGNDAINSGAGNDMLDGGPDFDVLNGGPGTDTCVNGEVIVGCP